MGQAPRRRGLHPLGPGKIPLPGLRSFRRGSSPEKGTLPFACSVASALATARGRYHLFPGGGRGVTRLDERPGFSPPFWGWRKRRGACRGGGGAKRPHPQGRGPLAPALAAVLRALGPQNAAAPAWPPGLPAPPGPPILPMDAGWGWGRRAPWGTRRGGGVWRPGRPRRPGLPNQTGARGIGPGPRFRTLRAPPPPPPGVGILHRRPGGEGREGSQGVLQALEWRM